MNKVTRRAVAQAVLGALLLAGVALPAAAAPGHDKIVSAVPASTPAVNNGETDAIVQVGNTVVVGGTFTSATSTGGSPVARSYILAFDASTGQLSTSFVPTLNGSVNELLPGPTADTVYVGGAFSQVNGSSASHVTLLNLATGAVAGGFRAASTNGVVSAMARAGNRLVVGGSFTTAGGTAHAGLTSLNATTGALDGFIDNQVSGHHNDTGKGAVGPVGVRDLDLSPGGDRLVAIGNFKKVDGVARDQVVMLSLDAGATSVVTPDWNTDRYQPYCHYTAYDSYVRGVDFSPDGSYFVVTSTGGQGTGTLCDAAARFETRASGPSIQPTWVDYTGGDTLWSVAITESAVYVGGHQRWLNNSFGDNVAGAGAVPRPGLAALNADTGVPLAWNPGRNPRGAAVYALYATPTGLWMGSDTEYVGAHYRYKRPRLAFFPLAGGAPQASDATASIPGTAYRGGPSGDTLSSVAVSGSAVSSAVPQPSGGVQWSQVRGSFMAGGKLWYGHSDGSFYSRTVNGSTFGPAVKVDPYADPVWAGISTGSGNTYDGKTVGLYSQIPTVTGMAYAAGKLYYTRENSPNLYWRWFNTDSGIVGADEFVANGARSWSDTMGMFAAAGELYFGSRSSGNLSSVALTPSGPSGAVSVVDGPARGGNDWRTRALYLGPPIAPPPTSRISFVASSRASANSTSSSLTVPAAVTAGDTMLLGAAVNNTPTVATPSGWTLVDREATTGLTSYLWRRTATAADAGSSVVVRLDGVAKTTVALAAYRGVRTSDPVAALSTASDSGTASHTSPAVTAPAGSWIVTMWTDKSTSTGAWTTPGSVVKRSEAYSTGSGRVSIAVADADAPTAGGTVPGVTASTDVPSSRALSWTIALGSAQ